MFMFLYYVVNLLELKGILFYVMIFRILCVVNIWLRWSMVEVVDVNFGIFRSFVDSNEEVFI